jgi:acetoin utilization deacetylase AcuC-like enzyme
VSLVVAGPVGIGCHLAGSSHPERDSRVRAVMAGLGDLELGDELRLVQARPAAREDLLRVHSAAYLDALERFCSRGGGELDPDTYARADSWDAARLAAGAGLAAIAELDELGDGIAFMPVRPPGHHAEPDRAMGFCLLNNVAIAAASLVARGSRVLVLDWDVHHGNGTQDIFWDDPRVLYVSTHQFPLYPGTGRPDETGGRAAPDSTVNVPLPPGATGDVMLAALDQIARQRIETFSPDWVLVSCGFDAHRADPLAELALSGGDFAALGRLASELAPRPGRLALFLEGGYDLDALRSSVAATLGALLGVRREVEAPTGGGPGMERLRQIQQVRARALETAAAADGEER